MALSSYYNRVVFLSSTSGTADFTVNQAAPGARTPAQALIPNSTVVSYTAVTVDISQWECGQGTYVAGILTRTTIRSSSAGGVKVNFSIAPTVQLDFLAEDINALANSGVPDGNKGDITVSGTGVVWTINSQAVTYDKIQNVTATSRFLGRITSGAGSIEELTGTQATSLLNNFTDTLKGLVPLSGGGTLNFLRADGSWVPAALADGDKGDITVTSSGSVWTIDNNVVTYAKMQDVSATSRFLGRITAGSGDTEELTGTQATTLLDQFTSLLKGLVPASGGGTTTFLRADGNFASPAGGGDVTGPGVSVDSEIVIYSGTSGTVIKRATGTGVVHATAGVYSVGAVALASEVSGDLPFANLTQGTARSVLGVTGNATADFASIQGTADQVLVVNGAGTALTFATVATGGITAKAVTYAKIQDITATSRFLGRITGGAGVTEELTGTQATTLLDNFTSTLKGLAPLSGGGTSNFLRADGTWAAPAGGASAATQAEQEAGSSTTAYTSPGRQQYHPSAAKAWARWNAAVSVAANYNAPTVTDNGTGDWTVNFTTAFSSTSYGISGIPGQQATSTTTGITVGAAPAAGSCRIFIVAGNINVDPSGVDLCCASFFGDQA